MTEDANRSKHRLSGDNINLRPERQSTPLIGALPRLVKQENERKNK
jgi:hypothetical protein